LFDSWTSENSDHVKIFFGKPARVLAAAWIIARRGESFYQQEATSALGPAGESPSQTRDALELFVEEGLLSAMNDGRRRYYTQAEHPLWAAYEAISVSVGLSVLAN